MTQAKTLENIRSNPVLRFVAFAILAIIALMAFGDASAQGAVGKAALTPLCGLYKLLNGPVGWGLGLLMIAFGAIMLMVGNRNANGIVISAIVGGIVLAMSGSLLGLVLNSAKGGPSAADPCDNAKYKGL